MWGQGTEGWEPRQIGGGRQERKGREAGVLRRRESGEKYNDNFCHLFINILSKTRAQNVI